MKTEYHKSPEEDWGEAIHTVYIKDNGEMWVSNNEYSTRVNFNPWTGEPAPKQMENKENQWI